MEEAAPSSISGPLDTDVTFTTEFGGYYGIEDHPHTASTVLSILDSPRHTWNGSQWKGRH